MWDSKKNFFSPTTIDIPTKKPYIFPNLNYKRRGAMVFCGRPFENIRIEWDGSIRVCCYIKEPLGNVFQDDIEDIWNSGCAKKIRDSILDQSYKYCDKKFCHIAARTNNVVRGNGIPGDSEIDSDMKKTISSCQPKRFEFAHDHSCNIYCTSCRKRISHIPKSTVKKLIKFQEDLIKKDFIRNVEFFNISGAGEPFASKVYLDLMKRINQIEFPKLKIDFLTNGLLLTPRMWKNLERLHYAVNVINVSIDAAAESTYKKVRRGGNFKRLQKNLEHLSQLRTNNKCKGLGFRYVVYSENFHEMVEFVKLGQRFNCDWIYFQLIVKFSVFTDDEYRRLAVHNKNHPGHKDFLKILRDPIFNEKNVFLQNIKPFREKSLKS